MSIERLFAVIILTVHIYAQLYNIQYLNRILLNLKVFAAILFPCEHLHQMLYIHYDTCTDFLYLFSLIRLRFYNKKNMKINNIYLIMKVVKVVSDSFLKGL